MSPSTDHLQRTSDLSPDPEYGKPKLKQTMLRFKRAHETLEKCDDLRKMTSSISRPSPVPAAGKRRRKRKRGVATEKDVIEHEMTDGPVSPIHETYSPSKDSVTWFHLREPDRDLNSCPLMVAGVRETGSPGSYEIVRHITKRCLEMGHGVDVIMLTCTMVECILSSEKDTPFDIGIVYDTFEIVNTCMWVAAKYGRDYNESCEGDLRNWWVRGYYCAVPDSCSCTKPSRTLVMGKLEPEILKRIEYRLTRHTHVEYALRFFFFCCAQFGVNGWALYRSHVLDSDGSVELYADHPLVYLLEMIIIACVYAVLVSGTDDARPEKRNKNSDYIGYMIGLQCLRFVMSHDGTLWSKAVGHAEVVRVLSPVVELYVVHSRSMGFVNTVFAEIRASEILFADMAGTIVSACTDQPVTYVNRRVEALRVLFS